MRLLPRFALPMLLLFAASGSPARPLPVPPRLHGQLPAGTVRPEQKSVRRVIEQPAQNVESFAQAPLHSRLSAYVGKVYVDIGDRVKKGDVLLELSVPELDAELKQKTAAVEQALAESTRAAKVLSAAEANTRSASAAVREAESTRTRAEAERARAKSQYERLSRAGQSGVLDRESVAESRYTYESAEAAVGEVTAKVKSMQALRDESDSRRESAAAEVEVAKSRHRVAVANREQTSALLGYAKIVAPFDGIVTQRAVDQGHYVQPTTSTPLLTVEQPDRLRVFVQVPESEARWLNGTGPVARIKGQSLGGKVLEGKVSRTAFALDAKTRTLRTELDVANPNWVLRPGSFVTVSITVERANAWTLPASAIRQRDGEVWCFVVEGGKARRQALETGLEGAGLVEIRRIGGAEPTGKEVVVSNPGAALKDGDEVK